MNIKQITLEYLTAHGFDGLVCPGGVCGCNISDLMACSDPSEYCACAYQITPNPSDSDNEYMMLPAYDEQGNLRTREQAEAEYREEEDDGD